MISSLHSAAPANDQPGSVTFVAGELLGEAWQARAALRDGDAAAARRHILRLILAQVPIDAPPPLAKSIDRRRLNLVVDLADQYARMRGLSPAPSAPLSRTVDFGAK